jgi:hypothetical protein
MLLSGVLLHLSDFSFILVLLVAKAVVGSPSHNFVLKLTAGSLDITLLRPGSVFNFLDRLGSFNSEMPRLA